MALTVAVVVLILVGERPGSGLAVWLTVGMLLSSAASAVAIWINLRRGRTRDDRLDLHEAIDRIDDELKECRMVTASLRERNAILADENLRLLRELVACRRDDRV